MNNTLKIYDGITHLYRWDTGVKIEMCGFSNVTECHFVTSEGLIKREVEDNICAVPDCALTEAGILVVYAFSRTEDCGVTRHEFKIDVWNRPKPSDYVDPVDEYDNLQDLAERVSEMVAPGKTPVKGVDYFTEEDIASQNIPSDEHINELINTALGAIENGAY